MQWKSLLHLDNESDKRVGALGKRDNAFAVCIYIFRGDVRSFDKRKKLLINGT